jgi:predicted site-specific integrase-resolvase
METAPPEFQFRRKRLTRPEVARIFDVSERTVRRWVIEGLLEEVPLGDRAARYEEAAVEKFYLKRKKKSEQRDR